ncbi:hypothetical protein ACFSBZ_13575 [Amnibacterium flavum]|uniref:SCP domain-containing protein n=1 Tax=Amnibacterium flavum TaxID=2173173 RepID=A0A2V1HU00_9MICO|nr:hypothetical protein [Amnibacterium flavum]PVZ95791.1 hypothetical protein DDQ50_04780 [Amnibacterium flavum]
MTTIITSGLAAGLPFLATAVADASDQGTSTTVVSSQVHLGPRAVSAQLRQGAHDASSSAESAVAAAAAIDERDRAEGDGATCAANITGATARVATISFDGGAITGTSSDDLAEFATRFNEIRVENCLDPVPVENFRYGACMEQRLVWMAEDPSTDPASAWGHEGSVRSDGVPSVGCDGNLAGGSDNTGVTVAQKWWDSPAHRASLYRPDIAEVDDDVCVVFAMTHGGIPNEPASFARAAARWTHCSEL